MKKSEKTADLEVGIELKEREAAISSESPPDEKPSKPNRVATPSELFLLADSKDKMWTGVGFFMAFISGCNQPAQLIIFGSILDAFNGSSTQSSVGMVTFLAIMYVVVAIQMFLTNFLQTACMSASSGRQTKRLREKYFSALLRQCVAYFDSNDQGALATSVMERTLLFQDGMGEKLAMGVQFATAFFAGLAVALYYVWQLALLLMGVVPVLAVTIGLIVSVLQKSSEESTNAYTAAGSVAQQALGAIRTIFALGAEKREVEKYTTQLAVAEAAGIKRWKATGVMAGFVTLVMWLAYGLGLWFGAFLISRDMKARMECNYYPVIQPDGTTSLHVPESGCITGGNVMICFFSVIFGGLNLGQAFPSISAVNVAMIELGKILDVVENESPIDPTSDEGNKLDNVHGEIRLQDVTFAYPMRPDHDVYSGINLTVEAGSTVALVGPSGCGKSTAVSLIERFYDPRSGSVLLDGVDIKTLNVGWLRSQIGLVSQEPVLFTGSIADNIANGKPGVTQQEIEEAAKMANAHDFIMKFADGYKTQVGEKGIQLSGGQKQRVAIARAIVRDPKILILDEATSALDTTSERVVQKALDNLLKMKKRTTIVIAHRLSTIRNADKIVVLNQGVVVEEGTHNNLLMSPDSLYGTLVKMQTASKEITESEKSKLLEGVVDDDNVSDSAPQPSKATGVTGVDIVDSTVGSVTACISPGDVEMGTLEESQSGEKTTKTATLSAVPVGYGKLRTDEGKDGDDAEEEDEDNVVKMEENLKKTPAGKAILETEKEVEEKTSSFGWVWALSAPERPYLCVGLIGAVVVGAAFPLLGFLLSAMIKIFFNPDPNDMLVQASFYAYIFILLAGSQFIGSFVTQYCFGVMTERLAKRVREKSFTKMLQMEVGWFDQAENTAGTLAQRLATDCVMMKALTGERASTAASQTVTFAVSLAIAFYHSWEMTLVMVGLFPIIGAAFAVQNAFVVKVAGAAMTATNDAGQIASQALLNIRTVNAFGLEKMSLTAFQSQLEKPLQQFIRKGLYTGAGMGFGQFVILAGAGLAYYVGGQLVLLGRATFPDIMAVILSVMFGAVGLGQFAATASDQAEAIVAAKKIQKLWNTAVNITAFNESGNCLDNVHGEIRLQDVTFAYPMRPDHDVYSGINLTVEAGSTVALVGPSGCGKSTAVSLIERFYDPRSGSVLLDGVDIKTLKLSWLREQIGLVSQEPVLFSGSIAENIAYSKPNATQEEIEEAAKMANAHEFIMKFVDGYKTQVGEKGIQLSGGQKQRVAIARAIVRDPKILILDEATSALDTASERIVQEALDNLLKMKKRTTIVIAHRLSTIRNADKIVVFMDGVVVEQGTHEELMASAAGHYASLVRNADRGKDLE